MLRFVQDYKLNLLTPADIAEEDFAKFRTGLGAVMQFAKHRNDNDVSWMEGNKRFEQMDWDTASLIKTVTGANIQIEKGESVNMWAAWENGINQARNDGFADGETKGKLDMAMTFARKYNILPKKPYRLPGSARPNGTHMSSPRVTRRNIQHSRFSVSHQRGGYFSGFINHSTITHTFKRLHGYTFQR